jgi:hypothetical protein
MIDGDGGQGGDIGPGDVLVFTMEILHINGASRPAERGPPPFIDLQGDVAAYEAMAKKPTVLAALRQPVGSAKLFAAFKGASRALMKQDGYTAESFAFTAASKFDGKAFTTDPLAAKLKLQAPSIYVLGPDDKYSKCKTGRPSEFTADTMRETIVTCVDVLQSSKKTEL